MTKPIPLSRAATTVAAVLGVCLIVFACPGAAFAKAAAKEAAQTGENTPLNLDQSSGAAHTSGGGASIVRTIVGLAIVIAVIWGLSWILRQVKSGREPQISSSAGLTSVAALTLGAGRSVHLVRAGSDYVLLGSAEHGVVPIHRYTEEEARDAGLLGLEHAPARAPRKSILTGPLLRPPEPQLGAPFAQHHHDPMRMPGGAGPSSKVVDRLRELTVRR